MSPKVPIFLLYEAGPADPAEVWLHCEKIPDRAALHDFRIRPHRHRRHFQILFVTNGRVDVFTGDRHELHDAPLAVFVPSRAVHGFIFSPDADGWVVTAFDEVLQSLAQTSGQLRDFAAQQRIIALDPNLPAARDFGRLITRMNLELGGSAFGRMLLLDALLRATIVNLARAANLSEPVLRAQAPNAERFAALEELIEKNFRLHKPVQFYADALHVSQTQLNRICRAHTGRGLLSLLHKRLIDAALRELLFSDASVKSIASGLGFSDPAYFNRFFKAKVGMSPGQFSKTERTLLYNL